MCTQRGFSSCDGILKYKLKVRLVIRFALILIYHRNWKILTVCTYPVVYFITFYFTYIVSNWDPNLHFMSQFM